MSYGVVVINPKFRANIGMILRLSAGFGAKHFYWTGDRAQPEIGPGGVTRIPREERMEIYTSKVITANLPLETFLFSAWNGQTPVAITQDGNESLTTFQHPDNAWYIFGAEDKGIPQSVRRICHRFVYIPSDVVLNLATAVAITLYDRRSKNA